MRDGTGWAHVMSSSVDDSQHSCLLGSRVFVVAVIHGLDLHALQLVGATVCCFNVHIMIHACHMTLSFACNKP